jgi:anti-sigma-K factor RskA
MDGVNPKSTHPKSKIEMTGSSSPEHLEELITGYVLGDLNSEEVEEFERLLAENPQLATEVQSLQAVFNLLPYTLPDVEPPPNLRSAILEAVAPSKRDRAGRKVIRGQWSPILGSAAALLALVFGLDNYRLRQELKLQRAQQNVITVLQQPNTRLLSLVGTDKANTASGSIAIALDAQKAAIALQNLPPAPADRIYRLWAIVDERAIACAEFSASQQGTVLGEVSLHVPACSQTKSTLAVSLEPSSLPPQPAGPIVMVVKSPST